MMQTKKDLWELTYPSTELEQVLFGELRDGGVSLTLERLVDGGPRTTQLRFRGVRAFRHRAETHCQVWHIDAYDTLAEVCDSEWVRELVDAMPEDLRELFEMHHFLMYLDSSGSYEVVAASWEVSSEHPV